MNITIWYLYHSGFALETENHFLIFDYWKSTPSGGSLEDGVISPAQLKDKGKKVVVFVSHAHADHYNPEILGWAKECPGLRMILSDDIPTASNALMIGPNQTLRQEDFTVSTLASTDEGVAFLVEIDGLRLYHAGDLNWWHWSGETPQYNAVMDYNYKKQIKLIDKPIDVAFVPVDPRLESQYCWGIDYLMRNVQVTHAIPMHFGAEHAVVDRLLADPAAADYAQQVIPLVKRGQSVTLNF